MTSPRLILFAVVAPAQFMTAFLTGAKIFQSLN